MLRLYIVTLLFNLYSEYLIRNTRLVIWELIFTTWYIYICLVMISLLNAHFDPDMREPHSSTEWGKKRT